MSLSFGNGDEAGDRELSWGRSFSIGCRPLRTSGGSTWAAATGLLPSRSSSAAHDRAFAELFRQRAQEEVEGQASTMVKTWLLAQIEKKQAAPASDMVEAASDEQFAPERLAA
jgi:hypothetical protein